MSENNEILPCPFCGGKSRVHKYLTKWYARCNKCNTYSAPYDTPEQATAAWNTRFYVVGADFKTTNDHLNRSCANCNYANYDYKPIEGQIFCCRFNAHYRYDDYCYKFQKNEGD